MELVSIRGDTVMDFVSVDFVGQKMIEERSVKASEVSMDSIEKNIHFSTRNSQKPTCQHCFRVPGPTKVEKKLDFLAPKTKKRRRCPKFHIALRRLMCLWSRGLQIANDFSWHRHLGLLLCPAGLCWQETDNINFFKRQH